MFTCTRKPGQSIQVGDDISIHVLKSSAGRVKLGVAAPQAIPLLRGELVEQGVLPFPHVAPLLRTTLAPILVDDQFIERFKAHPTKENVIVGNWAEDGSTYEITVPHQLRGAFLTLLNSAPRLIGMLPRRKTMCLAA